MAFLDFVLMWIKFWFYQGGYIYNTLFFPKLSKKKNTFIYNIRIQVGGGRGTFLFEVL